MAFSRKKVINNTKENIIHPTQRDLVSELCSTAINLKTQKSTIFHSIQKSIKCYCDHRKVTSVCFFLLIKKAKSNKQDAEAKSKMKREINQMAGEYIYVFLNYSQITKKRKIKIFHLPYNLCSFTKEFLDIFI